MALVALLVAPLSASSGFLPACDGPKAATSSSTATKYFSLLVNVSPMLQESIQSALPLTSLLLLAKKLLSYMDVCMYKLPIYKNLYISERRHQANFLIIQSPHHHHHHIKGSEPPALLSKCIPNIIFLEYASCAVDDSSEGQLLGARYQTKVSLPYPIYPVWICHQSYLHKYKHVNRS